MPKSRVLSKYTNKSDTLRPAHNTNNNVWTDFTIGGSSPNTMILFNPTYRQKRFMSNVAVSPDQPHQRHTTTTYISGYKERISVFSLLPCTWRRIVFWSYQRVLAAAGPLKGGAEHQVQAYYTRQMTPVENSQDLRNWIFQGTQGVDYTKETLIRAPVNHKHIDVVMDKTYNLQGTQSNPKSYSFKHYFPGGRLIYDDNEQGGYDSITGGYSTTSRKSKGNLYIFDMWSDGGFITSSESKAGGFQAEGRLFWSE